MAEETKPQTDQAGENIEDNAALSAINIPQNVRNLHNKALAALERNNTDIAIELFVKCVEQCPEYLAARRNLRLTEIARYKATKGNKAINHQISSISGAIPMMKTKGMIKSGKTAEALLEAERLLLMDPLNIKFVKVFCDAAVAAGQTEAAVMTVETVKEQLPHGNMEIVELMGRMYYAIKNYRKARESLEKIHMKRPGDMEITKMLKDSEALATLDSGWVESEKSGDYRAVLANKEEAEKLEQANKMVKSESDADTIIKETLEKIEKEPNNVNYYLSLASLYAQQKSYAEALDIIEKARSMTGGDAELDRRYANIKTEKYDIEIEALREAGNTEAADAMEGERNQYVFDDISERVARYPNDQHLRYELGMQYFKYDYFDEAIQQFQIAQKSPKDRVSALYHMAICFRQKGLLDMAVSQLEQAVEFLPTMNAEKMDIYYLMGEICEEEGRLDDAAKYFKEIYRVDVTYRDIARRVEAIYAAQKNAKK